MKQPAHDVAGCFFLVDVVGLEGVGFFGDFNG
jgi:hypothetical protein